MSAATENNDPNLLSIITIHLKKIPLLAGLAPALLEKLAFEIHLRKIERSQQVIHKGSSGDHLLFLLSGRLQAVDLTADGRGVGLNFLNVGDYFGELSIIDGLPRSASVVATENSLVAFLPRDQALDLIYQNPLVAERLLKRMAENIRLSVTYRAIIGIPNAFQRVFALINELAKIAPGGLVVIEKMPTQQEIAITVNTSRETVSRAVQILIQMGIVEKDLRRLIIRKPDALRHAVINEL